MKVEWKGQWYEAEILEEKNGKYYIHYSGYDSSWDEWITSDRIRR